LNEGQIPNVRVLRVALGTGYNRGEENRRASRNGRVSDLPPETPHVTIRHFCVAVRRTAETGEGGCGRSSGRRGRGRRAEAEGGRSGGGGSGGGGGRRGGGGGEGEATGGGRGRDGRRGGTETTQAAAWRHQVTACQMKCVANTTCRGAPRVRRMVARDGQAYANHAFRKRGSSVDMQKLRTELVGFRVGDRSRGRFATPADSALEHCSPYSLVHARREGLGFVRTTRTIFCRPVPNDSYRVSCAARASQFPNSKDAALSARVYLEALLLHRSRSQLRRRREGRRRRRVQRSRSQRRRREVVWRRRVH
jgi:hypothetical protein